MLAPVFFLLALTHLWTPPSSTPATAASTTLPVEGLSSKPPPPPATAGEQLKGTGARLLGAQLRWGGPQDQERWGGALSTQGFGLFTGRWMSMRYQDRLQVGAQGGALHLRLHLQAALGGFWRLWKEHGIVARLGVVLDASRGPLHRTRWLRIPELQLGWAGSSGPLQYDLAALASPYVYHRATRPQHWNLTEHSASLGGVATLVYRRIRLNLRGDWTPIQSAWRPRIQADLCLHLWARPADSSPKNPKIGRLRSWVGPYEQRYRAGLCASAMASTMTGPRESNQTRHIALSLLLGKISFLDPTR